MKASLKNALIIILIFVILSYMLYFRPKKNANDTVFKFKEINEKNNCNLIYEFKPNIIDISNPWRYGTTETIIYDDPRSDSAIKLYFPYGILTKIKVFNSCSLNSDYKYNFSKCIVFYSKERDSIFIDEYEIDMERYSSGDLRDSEIDSMSNLYSKKYNNRYMKVSKNREGVFQFYFLNENKYELSGYSTSYFKYDCLFK